MLPNDQIAYQIASQFPAIYREDGAELVAFVEAYYEYLEQTRQYSVAEARNLLSYKDIDLTLDEFVTHFKDKYLRDFPFVAASDNRFIIKHVIDLYRSRGSEKSLKLLMMMLFGEDSEVYYPAQDIFKPSDSRYVIPTYIEVSREERTRGFVGKKIYGATSGASATVDGYVTKRVNGLLIDVLYLSQVSGTFLREEYVTDDGSLTDAPFVFGSLDGIEITNGGLNFEVGQILDVNSDTGKDGKARVDSVAAATDRVAFSILDNGYGYSLDTNYTKVYTTDGVNGRIIRLTDDFSGALLYDVKQFNVSYESPGLANTSVGDIVWCTANTGSTDIVDPLRKGVISDVSGNTVTVTWDASAISDVAGTYGVEDYVTPLDFEALYVPSQAELDAYAVANPGDLYAIANTGQSALGPVDVTTANTANEVAHAFVIGTRGSSLGTYYYDSSNSTFQQTLVGTDPQVVVYSPVKDIVRYSDLTLIERGVDFTIRLPSANTELKNQETVSRNTDVITDYLSTALDSADFGFPAAGTETLTTELGTALSYDTFTVGQLLSVTGLNPGSGYQSDPFAMIHTPAVLTAFKPDVTVRITLDDLVALAVGDEIVIVGGAKDGAVGVVKSFTFTAPLAVTVSLRLNTFNHDFEVGDDITIRNPTSLASKVTGAVASVVDQTPTTLRDYMGLNFRARSAVNAAGGVVTSLNVVQSGFGYQDGQEVTLVFDGLDLTVTGNALAQTQGKSLGYYLTTTSHLDSTSRIRDRRFYQEYSYQVRCGLSIDKYRKVIKDTIHVAGTELFGEVNKVSEHSKESQGVETSIEVL
jgi:hypothetical protein